MFHYAKVDAWVTVLFGGLFLLEFVIGVGSVVAALFFGVLSLRVTLVISSISAAGGRPWCSGRRFRAFAQKIYPRRAAIITGYVRSYADLVADRGG
jgi:hypothetical protein